MFILHSGTRRLEVVRSPVGGCSVSRSAFTFAVITEERLVSVTAYLLEICDVGVFSR